MSVLELPVVEPLRFLQAVFGELDELQAIHLWTLPDRRSAFFPDAASAAGWAVREADRLDVYVGVGLRRRGALAAGKRGGTSDVIALPALVADFDIRPEQEAGAKPYPRSLEELEQILAALPLAPSATVHSGGGVHAWWIFKEPVEIPDELARETLRALSAGWGAVIAAAAHRHGRAVDSVHDLARVLRLPGTTNHKRGERRPVRLLELSDRRYTPADFEPFAAPVLRNVRAGIGAIRLDPDAEPDPERLLELFEVEPRAAATWEGKRRDLKDQSASSYDLALANTAALAGWTDQEIADLLIARRRRRGDDLKLREDYYTRTIAKARADLEPAALARELELERVAIATLPSTPEDRAAHQSKALNLLRMQTGLAVERIFALGEQKVRYQVQLADGRIVPLGDSDAFSKYSTWWRLALELSRTAPTKQPSRAAWMQALATAQAAIEVQPDDEVQELELLRDKLRKYLTRAVDVAGCGAAERDEIVRAGLPFVDDGSSFVSLPNFREHLALQRDKADPRELLMLFRLAGFESIRFATGPKDGRASRRFWRIPQEWTA